MRLELGRTMHHLLRSTTCLRRCTKLEPRPDEGSDDTNCSTMQDLQMSPDNVSGAKVSNAPLEKLHEEEPGQQKEEDKPGLHTEKHGLQIPKEKPRRWWPGPRSQRWRLGRPESPGGAR